MGLKDYFYYAGKPSLEFEIIIEEAITKKAAQRDVTTISIPGRNGSLIIDNGRFENESATYKCGIGKHFLKNIYALNNFLMAQRGYNRLEDTYQPEVFRLARVESPPDPDMLLKRKMGKFDVIFGCRPERFLKDGEIEKTYQGNGSIFNPTNFASKPLIKVTGAGTVGLGDETITVTGTSSQVIYIDSDIHDAYEYSGSSIVNANGKVSFTSTDFPEIQPGESGITLGSGISKVEITPRWWTI